MGVTIYINSRSCEESIKFYVHELLLFHVVYNYGMGNCLLQYRNGSNVFLYLSDSYNVPGSAPVFSLDVSNCQAEFRRLQGNPFIRRHIVAGPSGGIELFEYPGGVNFMLEDPYKNRFLINENYGDLHMPDPAASAP